MSADSSSTGTGNAFDEMSDTVACAIVLAVMFVGTLAGGYVAFVVSAALATAKFTLTP